jgi:predicted nuclease of predicted toxin-antitoxin system
VKLKLDENLADGHRTRLELAGHDVRTVVQQGMGGAGDSDLFETCKKERRALVTLDLDFSNVLAFPPGDTAGVVVLRGRDALLRTIEVLIDNLSQALEHDDPTGKLWIVEPGRLRIHLEGDE